MLASVTGKVRFWRKFVSPPRDKGADERTIRSVALAVGIQRRAEPRIGLKPQEPRDFEGGFSLRLQSRAAITTTTTTTTATANATHGEFGLAQGRRHVQVVRDVDVAEIVLVLHAPEGQPVDRVHRQAPGQLDLYVFSLVGLQRFQAENFKITSDAFNRRWEGGLLTRAAPNINCPGETRFRSMNPLTK